MIMSVYGRQVYTDLDTGRTFIIEPITQFPNRNADWVNGIKTDDLPNQGAICEHQSIIHPTNYKQVWYTDIGESPYSSIEKVLNK